MSLRNPVTGRHEDDLFREAHQNAGEVSVTSLIAHLEEIVVGSGAGSTVEHPTASAARLLKAWADFMPTHVKLG